MTSKFDSLFENMMDSITGTALQPIGALSITEEPVDGSDDGDSEGDDAPETSETEIATKILHHIKKLRRTVGETSYYRAKKIEDLASKLLGLHPDSTTVEIKPTI
jgi:hypothetical protein